jgi:aryl-alcohol dehydrogenase-like predicted oxidoreductase
VAWVLHNPAVIAAIVGARSAQQVEQNIGAVELDLTDDDIAQIEASNVQQPELVTAD